MKLVLLRHGESEWNLSNKFTGWTDVNLTDKGKREAIFAAKQIKKNNIHIKSIYTSILTRATHTSCLVANEIGFEKNKINYNWRLNERHYGALQGLNKSETASQYGEDQVKIWRRSYNIPPPLLNFDDKRHPKFDEKFKKIQKNLLPSGESLELVVERIKPFFEEYLANIDQKSDHLIVAHSNSLRAIIKQLEKLTNDEIVSVNIPTGAPLVYEIDNEMIVVNKYYLLSEEKIKKEQEKIINQGKIK